MDMQMPRMDGLEATAAIRKIERDGKRAPTPLAMLTANASPEHKQAAIAAGADGYISKPVTPEGLLSAVSEMLQAAEESREQSLDALFPADQRLVG
ncbi:MAG: response regulator, partial [Caulobacteraceae bacterium]